MGYPKLLPEETPPFLDAGPGVGLLESVVDPTVVNPEIVLEIAVLVLVPVLLAKPLATERWVPEPWNTWGSLQKRVHPGRKPFSECREHP